MILIQARDVALHSEQNEKEVYLCIAKSFDTYLYKYLKLYVFRVSQRFCNKYC